MFYSSRKRWSNRKAARAAQDVFNNVMDSSRRGIAGRVYVATPLKENCYTARAVAHVHRKALMASVQDAGSLAARAAKCFPSDGEVACAPAVLGMSAW